jgi:hypothetical protein
MTIRHCQQHLRRRHLQVLLQALHQLAAAECHSLRCCCLLL